jgi:uncharacterized protein (TIGR00369 family)
MTESKLRSATFTWHDPQTGPQAGQQMSGLEYIRKMAAGELPPPPIASLMNMKMAEVSEGLVVFVAAPAEYHYNPIGSVHGGFAATLLDSAMGCAVHTTLPAGVWWTTLELKTNYIRAMSVTTGNVRCEGKVIHAGGRMATAEGRITDADGKLLAHGSTTCMIFR